MMVLALLNRLFRSLLLIVCCVTLAVDCGSCRETNLCCPGRDSSCVVQKAPFSNAVAVAANENGNDNTVDGSSNNNNNNNSNDDDDKPCYCDHACLKLGDCCDDFKTACGVVDCQVSPWGSWSDCDAECGSGTMFRTRTIQSQAENGGRHCPSLEQRRGCQMSNCHHQQHHPDHAIKEIAMLLPGSLSKVRKANETSDIRINLRLSFPEDHPEYDPAKQYCVEFEILKASKACKKETNYAALQEGERVCVKCESQALRKNLNWRCQGHGVTGRITRWSALSQPHHCHGKWLRIGPETDRNCTARTCHDDGRSFIFV